MLTLLDVVLAWHVGWTAGARTQPSIELTIGDVDRSKRSIWLTLQGDEVSGQLTVWDSGEMDLEAYRNVDSSAVLRESRQVDTPTEVLRAIEEVVRACQ